MALGTVTAGRFTVLLYLFSILVSSAIIYGYGSSWYGEAVLTNSIQKNLKLRWSQFTPVVPASTNGTVILTSDFEFSNFAEADVYVAGFALRMYLLGFVASDMIAYRYFGDTIFLPKGSTKTFQISVMVPYASKAPIFYTATSTENWLWIAHIALRAETGDISLFTCFRASLQAQVNATIQDLAFPSDSCNVPAPRGGGGGGV